MLKLIFSVNLIYFYLIKFSSSATDKVICYYQSWASDFTPRDINPNICTHINYAFLGLNSDGSLRLNGNTDVIERLRDLKNVNPNLKLLFSVGGWNEGSKIFSSIAASSKKLNKMASNAVEFLKIYQFDGIDIDWEYPAKRGGKPTDKKNFITLLKTLRKKFKSNKYLLSVAVGANPYSDSYDVPKIAEQVDFINLMTYDFHGTSEIAGHNAPLYPSSRDSQWNKKYGNCDAAVKNWKERLNSGNKLILGLAFYGHSYKLKNSKIHGTGAPIVGNNGQLSYQAICKLRSGWKTVFNVEQKVPYKYKSFTWISYDNPVSIRAKVLYAKKKELGGVMIWAVDQDDKNGFCGTKFGLLKEIKNNI